eukprot:SAG11_NODE_26362_length_346_cov_0.829960_1_plen_49_part_01
MQAQSAAAAARAAAILVGCIALADSKATWGEGVLQLLHALLLARPTLPV